MPRTVIVSGGFDPLHSGHIAYLTAAAKLGDRLVVGVNSDGWLICKKGRAFMPLQERLAIIRALGCVDAAISFDDKDGTALRLIDAVRAAYPQDRLIFANGGDRTRDNIPEMTAKGVTFVFGVGGEDKQNSSSWILREWQAPTVEKLWGHYRVLHEAPGVKVKELVVEPGQKLSMQRHRYRSEHWHIAEGRAVVCLDGDIAVLSQHDAVEIDCGSWHCLANPFDEILRVVEIQYGLECVEDDIERVTAT
jgi:cytidyltransferase-like protein